MHCPTHRTVTDTLTLIDPQSQRHRSKKKDETPYYHADTELKQRQNTHSHKYSHINSRTLANTIDPNSATTKHTYTEKHTQTEQHSPTNKNSRKNTLTKHTL